MTTQNLESFENDKNITSLLLTTGNVSFTSNNSVFENDTIGDAEEVDIVSSDDVDYRVQMYQLVVPAFLFISLLAVLANSLVIVALRASRVRNAMVTLLLSLTISDIWSSSVIGLSLLMNSYLPIIFNTRPSPCLALSLEMFRTGGLLTAALHLLLIALLHCLGIIRPHLDKSLLRHYAFICCLAAWALPPAALFLLALSRPNQGLWNCVRVDFYYERQFRWAISGLLAALFLAISLCYARLLWILHIQQRKIPTLSVSAAAATGHAVAMSGGSSESRKRRRERRTMGTTLLICASFLLGWAPASVLFALTCADCHLLGSSFRLLFGLSCLQLSFLLAKSLMNPLIYSLRVPEVRQQFRRDRWPLVGSLIRLIRTGSSSCMTTSKPTGANWRKRSHLFNSSFSSIGARDDNHNNCANPQFPQHRPNSLLLLVPDRPTVHHFRGSSQPAADEQAKLVNGNGDLQLNVPSRRSEPFGKWLLHLPRRERRNCGGNVCHTQSADQ